MPDLNGKRYEMESKEMKQYEEYVDKNILSDIRKVERRKVLAREGAYKIRISALLCPRSLSAR